MKAILSALWADDRGAILTAEYLMLTSVVGVGTVWGLCEVRDSVNTELADLGSVYRGVVARQAYPAMVPTRAVGRAAYVPQPVFTQLVVSEPYEGQGTDAPFVPAGLFSPLPTN